MILSIDLVTEIKRLLCSLGARNYPDLATAIEEAVAQASLDNS
jgi:hypothetical protein